MFNRHPVLLMIYVWAICFAAFFILPFEMVGRTLSGFGLAALGASIAVFCFGGLFRSVQNQIRGGVTAIAGSLPVMLDFKRADRVLIGATALSMALLVPLIFQNNVLSLEEAWLSRSDRAFDVMMGAASNASILYQLSFLLYPASHVILVRELVFKQSPNMVRLGLFAFLPVLLMSLVMGGRAPLLYTLALVPLSIAVRRRLFPREVVKGRSWSARGVFLAVIFAVMCLAASNYFIQVFVIRFESVGGIERMFEHAATAWGVTFSGPFADYLEATLGSGNTYLLFVFVWYFVQGIPISNEFFTNYDGPSHLGLFGIELVTAVMRRVNGDLVFDRFYSLAQMNTIGFSPSAFGSLYVDFNWFGLIFVFLWGYFATIVYNKTRQTSDPRWFLLVPFITLGIIFSPINTPLGFANGTVIHVWVLIAFFAIRSKTPTYERHMMAEERPRHDVNADRRVTGAESGR